MNCGPKIELPAGHRPLCAETRFSRAWSATISALPADYRVLCSSCGTAQPVANFGAAQLKKKHPRCRSCAPNKFSNQSAGGHASRREHRRAQDLRIQQSAGIIRDLREQVPFELIPAQRDEAGKVIERACTYIADFTYTLVSDNSFHVLDAKGMRTEKYLIKRKLMLHVHKIRIEEI